MDNNFGVLIDVLANLHAIVQPLRRHLFTTESAAARWELMANYDGAGLPWTSGESAAAERKAAQRELESLATAKLVKTYHHVGRTVGVGLTPLGLTTAERLCGLGGAREGFKTLRRLLAIRAEGHDANYADRFKGLIPETLLANCEWGGDTKPFAKLVYDVVPAISRRWINSESSVQGHVWYRITKSGERAAKNSGNGKRQAGLPEPAEHWADRYFDTLKDARYRLAAMTPRDPSQIGPIPLPVSYGRCVDA